MTQETNIQQGHAAVHDDIFAGYGHSTLTNIVPDLLQAADRRIADGLLDEEERDEFVSHIEERLAAQISSARLLHPTRMRAKGR